MTAKEKVLKIYKHAHICKVDYFNPYVYHASCNDILCCSSKYARYIGCTGSTEEIAWENTWDMIKRKMLTMLEH